jgi:hypothetical protein
VARGGLPGQPDGWLDQPFEREIVEMRRKPLALTSITLTPANRHKKTLCFGLHFHRAESLEFKLSRDDAMFLLFALQHLQRRKGWRVPQWSRPNGKPALRVVKDDPND